jgi:hypothetical protein
MPAQKSLLGTALNAGSPLRGQIKHGLRALKNVDHELIATAIRSEVGDSLDLDTAMRDEFPQANRWDYLLSVPHIKQIVGLEPHSARDSEISVVIAKKRQAFDYLRDHLPPKFRVAKWIWVSHGRTSFSMMESAKRRLDQEGIAYEGRMLKSF